jgi:site-specific DNA-methyltransferase (adenine-specific)
MRTITFDLAIVDPPYGIGFDGNDCKNKCKRYIFDKQHHIKKEWDIEIPSIRNILTNLFRVVKKSDYLGWQLFFGLFRCYNLVLLYWDKKMTRQTIL